MARVKQWQAAAEYLSRHPGVIDGSAEQFKRFAETFDPSSLLVGVFPR